MSLFCPVSGVNPDVDFQLQVVGYHTYAKALTILKSPTTLTDSNEYKSLIGKNPTTSKKSALINAIVEHIFYLDKEKRVEHINNYLKNAADNGKLLQAVRILNLVSDDTSVEIGQSGIVSLTHIDSDSNVERYIFNTEVGRLVPVPRGRKANYKYDILRIIKSRSGYYTPTAAMLKEDFGGEGQLTKEEIKEILNHLQKHAFLGSFISKDHGGPGHYFDSRHRNDGIKTSFDRKISSGESLEEVLPEAYNELQYIGKDSMEELESKAKAVSRICGLHSNKDNGISQQDQFVIREFLANYFADAIHMFLSHPVPTENSSEDDFCSVYLEDSLGQTNPEFYKEVKANIEKYSKERNFIGLFNIIHPIVLLQFARESLIYTDGKPRDAKLAAVLSDNDNFEAFIQLILPDIRNLTGVNLKPTIVKAGLELNLQTYAENWESNSDNSIYDLDENYQEDIDEDDSTYEEGTENSFANFLRDECNGLSIDVSKKNRDIITRAFSGILNKLASEISSEYSHAVWYDPYSIYRIIINQAHNVTNSYQMVDVIRQLDFDWVPEVLKRLEDPKLKTSVFKAIRKQKHRYIGAYELTAKKGETGGLTLSEQNRKTIRDMTNEVLEDINTGAIPDFSFTLDGYMTYKKYNGKYEVVPINGNKKSKKDLFVLINLLKKLSPTHQIFKSEGMDKIMGDDHSNGIHCPKNDFDPGVLNYITNAKTTEKNSAPFFRYKYTKEIPALFDKSLRTLCNKYPVTGDQDELDDVLRSLQISPDDKLYVIFNKIISRLQGNHFGINQFKSAAEMSQCVTPTWSKAIINKNTGKTKYTVVTVHDNYSKIIAILEDMVSEKPQHSVASSLRDLNSMLAPRGEDAEYESHFYAAKNAYYSLTNPDYVSRMDMCAHPEDNLPDDVKEDMQALLTAKLHQRAQNDKFLNAYCRLKGIDIDNDFSNVNAYSGDINWFIRGLSNAANLPKLHTFSAQETKKFHELNKLGQLLQSIVAFSGQVGKRSGGAAKYSHPFYSGLPIGDKSRSFFYHDEKQSGVLSTENCLQFLSTIIQAELLKIRLVYQEALKMSKDNPTYGKKYYPALKNGKIDFNSAKQCKFGYVDYLNDDYLSRINEVDLEKNRIDDKTLTEDEKNFIVLMANIIYNDIDQSNTESTEATHNKIAESLQKIGTIITDTDNSPLVKYINENQIEPILRLLYKYHQQLMPKLRFKLHDGVTIEPSIGEPYKLDLKDKDHELTFDEFKQAYIDSSSAAIEGYQRKNIGTVIHSYVYNLLVGLANQSMLLSGDMSIYEDSVDLSKRGGQFTSPGEAFDLDAVDSHFDHYETRTLDKYHYKVSFISISDIEVSKRDISTDNYNRISNPLISEKSLGLYNDLYDAKIEDLKKKIEQTEADPYRREALIKEVTDDVNAQRQTLLGKLCATDGQSWITPAAQRRLQGQIGDSSESLDIFLEKTSKLFDRAAEIIYNAKHNPAWQGTKENYEDLNKELNDKILYGSVDYDGYMRVLEDYYQSPDYVQMEPRKSFASGMVSHEAAKRVLMTQIKHSAICPIALDDLIKNGDYFMIELVSALQKGEIDMINPPSTIKNGMMGVIDTNGKTADEVIDTIKNIITPKGNPEYNPSFVSLMDTEDWCKQLEVGTHWFDTIDTMGTQLIKIMPSYIEDDGEYFTPHLDGSNGVKGTRGIDYYNEYQWLLAAKYSLSAKELYKKFNVQPGTDLYVKLINGQELNPRERAEVFRKFSDVFQVEINKSEYASVQHIMRYLLSEVDDTIDFMVPLSEGVNQQLLSKLITSSIKNGLIRQTVPGGQLVQAASLKEAFFEARNGNKQYLDNELSFTKEVDENGITHYYFEAEMPAQYPDMLDPYTDKKTGKVNMDKVPEYMKHAIMYRIPTEGMCSIFHIKVKRFSSKAAGGTIKLPAELPSIAGIDFDIDKLFAFIADLRKVNGKYEYKSSYAKITSRDSLRSLSEQQINNMLLERMIGMSNNTSHVYALLNPGGYEPLAKVCKRASLITTYRKALKLRGYNVNRVYDKDNGNFKISDDEVEKIIKSELNRTSPLTPLGRIEIIERNSIGNIVKGIAADANSLHCELSRKNIEYWVPKWNTAKGGISLNGKTIVPQYTNYNSTARFDPKYSHDQIHRVVDYIRQVLAASLDGAKDPVLYAAGITDFTAPIFINLLRMGIDLESAILIINQPIVREMNERYNVDKTVDPTGFYSFQNYIDNYTMQLSSVDIKTDALMNIHTLSKHYSELSEEEAINQQSLLGLLSIAASANEEMFKVKKLVKLDTSSDKTFSDMYHYVATSTSLEHYLTKNKETLNPTIKEHNTFFTHSIYMLTQEHELAYNPETHEIETVMDGDIPKYNQTFIPRVDVIRNELDQFLQSVLNITSPLLYSGMKALSYKWLNEYEGKLNADVVKEMYQQYLAYIMFHHEYTREYFNWFRDLQFRGDTSGLKKIHNRSHDLFNTANELTVKYQELSGNKFLQRLQLFTVKSKASIKAMEAEALPKLEYLGINSKNLRDEEINDIEDGFAILANLRLEKNGDGKLTEKAQEIGEFIDNLMSLSFIRNSFATITHNSPIRFMQAAVARTLFNGNYDKLFRDPKKGLTNTSLNPKVQSTFLRLFARHNGEYVKHQLQVGDKTIVYRKGSKIKKNFAFYVPVNGQYHPEAALGIPGLMSEYWRSDFNWNKYGGDYVTSSLIKYNRNTRDFWDKKNKEEREQANNNSKNYTKQQEEIVNELFMLDSPGKEIYFSNSNGFSYEDRTRENINVSDLTLIIATDFTSTGTSETINYARSKNKDIIYQLRGVNLTGQSRDIEYIANNIEEQIIAKCEQLKLNPSNIKLNIAGNGLSNLANIKGTTNKQEYYDALLYNILKVIQSNGRIHISRIVSGGQTGIDEAGANAGILLNIPTDIHTTKGWLDANNKNKASAKERKEQFIKRYSDKLNVYTPEKVEGITWCK